MSIPVDPEALKTVSDEYYSLGKDLMELLNPFVPRAFLEGHCFFSLKEN